MEGNLHLMLLLTLVCNISYVGSVWTTSQYEEVGPYNVQTFRTPLASWFNVDPSWDCARLGVPFAPNPSKEYSYEKPNVNIFIATPMNTSGTFPVILFKHGTMLANCLYSSLLSHVASYGYIVVAPQYSQLLIDTNCENEIDETIYVFNWLQDNLQILLNATLTEDQDILPDVNKIVISGHSRGGKVAYAMGMNMSSSINNSGLILLDPVDGTGQAFNPPIVTLPGVNLSFPVLIEGTGYGSEGVIPCAPKDYGHDAYYNVTNAPRVYHLSASQYGHMDFLDDNDIISWLLCKSGDSKTPFRKFTGGLMVAFLEYLFQGSEAPIVDVINNSSIELDEIRNKTTYTYDTNKPLYTITPVFLE